MISIIIPVYNVSKSLHQCLNSVRKQTYKDWECILVNDASTDNSLQICSDFARKDKRFIVINKHVNEGCETARYEGVMKASGDYIMFCDSDDWMETTILAETLQTIEHYGCDYVEVGIGRAIGRFKFQSNDKIENKLIKLPELSKFYISFYGINNLSVSLCGKLYNAIFLKKYYPSPVGLRYAEDAHVNLQIFPHLKSIHISNKVLYNHRWGGGTSKYNPSLLQDAKKYYWRRRDLLSTEYAHQCISDVERARYFLDLEQKNILMHDLKQRIIYSSTDLCSLKAELKNELQEQIWIDVRTCLNTHLYRDSITCQFVEGNVDEIISHIKKEIQRAHLLRITKQIIGRLLSRL